MHMFTILCWHIATSWCVSIKAPLQYSAKTKNLVSKLHIIEISALASC